MTEICLVVLACYSAQCTSSDSLCCLLVTQCCQQYPTVNHRIRGIMLVSFVKSENNFNNSSTLNGIKKEIRGDDIRLIRNL